MTSTFYNCGALDNIANLRGGLFIETIDGADGDAMAQGLTPEQYAAKVAGLVFRAFVNETVEIEGEYSYKIGAYMIDSADYGNGCASCFRYVEGLTAAEFSALWDVAGAREKAVLSDLRKVEPLKEPARRCVALVSLEGYRCSADLEEGRFVG